MRTPQSPRGGNGWGPFVTGVAVGVVVIALLAAAFAVGYSLGEARANDAAGEAGGASEPTPTDTGGGGGEAVLFEQTCGGCHTLAAAGSAGTVGPDLDALQPSRDQVLAAIANGGAGTGAMPADLLTGADAERVADYVAAVAGSGR